PLKVQNRVLRVHAKDNVLVALSNLKKGEQVQAEGLSLILRSDVPAKHKFAIRDLNAGDAVIMYGVLVGKAVLPIPAGGAVTTENVRHDAAGVEAKTASSTWTAPDVSRWNQRAFLGYHREDGQVGTRNYWVVVPLVFCENRNAAVLKQAFEEELGY